MARISPTIPLPLGGGSGISDFIPSQEFRRNNSLAGKSSQEKSSQENLRRKITAVRELIPPQHSHSPPGSGREFAGIEGRSLQLREFARSGYRS
jgi:hypothetical protein